MFCTRRVGGEHDGTNSPETTIKYFHRLLVIHLHHKQDLNGSVGKWSDYQLRVRGFKSHFGLKFLDFDFDFENER